MGYNPWGDIESDTTERLTLVTCKYRENGGITG